MRFTTEGTHGGRAAFKRVSTVLLSLTLSGCLSTAYYDAVSKRMDRRGYTWARLGKNYAPGTMSVPDSEIISPESEDLKECISDLNNALDAGREFSRKTGEAQYRMSEDEGLLTLVSCMATKGWGPVRIEVIVTS